MSIARSTSIAAAAAAALAAQSPGLTLRQAVEQIRIGEWSVRSQEAAARTAARSEWIAAIPVTETLSAGRERT